MLHKIKSRHIFGLVACIIVITFAFLGMFVFQWFIFSQNWLIINAILFLTMGGITFYYRSKAVSTNTVGNLGESGIVVILAFFAITGLVGGFTSLFGVTHHRTDSVNNYSYSFIRSCGYRLTLNEFSPIFGYFCHAGHSDSDFSENDTVALTGKESIFGTLITEIKSLHK